MKIFPDELKLLLKLFIVPSFCFLSFLFSFVFFFLSIENEPSQLKLQYIYIYIHFKGVHNYPLVNGSSINGNSK